MIKCGYASDPARKCRCRTPAVVGYQTLGADLAGAEQVVAAHVAEADESTRYHIDVLILHVDIQGQEFMTPRNPH